jgi:hypothetical protein
MTAAPAWNRPEEVTVNGVRAEFARFPDGKWHYRCPDQCPVNCREWHEGHPDREAALEDLRTRTATPVLTAAQVEAKRRHDYLSTVDGVPMVLMACPLTGATMLTAFEIVG